MKPSQSSSSNEPGAKSKPDFRSRSGADGNWNLNEAPEGSLLREATQQENVPNASGVIDSFSQVVIKKQEVRPPQPESHISVIQLTPVRTVEALLPGCPLLWFPGVGWSIFKHKVLILSLHHPQPPSAEPALQPSHSLQQQLPPGRQASHCCDVSPGHSPPNLHTAVLNHKADPDPQTLRFSSGYHCQFFSMTRKALHQPPLPLHPWTSPEFHPLKTPAHASAPLPFCLSP